MILLSWILLAAIITYWYWDIPNGGFRLWLIIVWHRVSLEMRLWCSQVHCQQRLFPIRKLKVLSVANHLLLLLHKSIIRSIILYRFPCFLTMLSASNRTSCPVIHTLLPKSLVSQPPTSLIYLNNTAITCTALIIVQNPAFPINQFCHSTSIWSQIQDTSMQNAFYPLPKWF